MPSQLTNHIRPFSHVPGDSCMLPSSSWKVTAYPTRISLENLNPNGEKIDFSLELEGPIQGYTLMQDLERDFVRVYGTAKEGYFSFRLTTEPDAILLLLERCPETGVSFSFQGKKRVLRRKETYAFPLPHELLVHSKEKIHLGCHKKQDWTLVKRRQNLEEILPFWFALGSKCPKQSIHYEGTAKLLKVCEERIQQQDRLQIGPSFMQLFQVGFGGILTPRLVDTDFQGIIATSTKLYGSSLVLLSHGAYLIRKLFLDIHEEELAILPCLPVELHAGYLMNMEVSDQLIVNIEWSKKTLRRLILRSKSAQTWKLKLQKDLKSFRMGDKRIRKEELLYLDKGKTYLLDRFEK